ncbi:hypothetical protein LINGRAHAP2_LOCUS9191 [Linum grandiflorum]
MKQTFQIAGAREEDQETEQLTTITVQVPYGVLLNSKQPTRRSAIKKILALPFAIPPKHGFIISQKALLLRRCKALNPIRINPGEQCVFAS